MTRYPRHRATVSLLALVILTTLMVVKSLQERHRLADIVTVADAGMLSAAIFRELDAAQFAVLGRFLRHEKPSDSTETSQHHAEVVVGVRKVVVNRFHCPSADGDCCASRWNGRGAQVQIVVVHDEFHRPCSE